MPGGLPGPRPLSAIDRKHLGIRRTLVQLDFEGVRVHLDKPCQRVPILLSRRTHANLVPPYLTARFGFVHLANIRAGRRLTGWSEPRSERDGLAGLAGIVAEDRNRPHRVDAIGSAGPFELVQAEDVPGAIIADGNGPVFAVVVTIVRASGDRDRGGVIVLQPPLARRVVLDQLGGLAVQDQGGVVTPPAQVELIGLAVVSQEPYLPST